MRGFAAGIQKLFICLIIMAMGMVGIWTNSDIREAKAAIEDFVYADNGDGTATITGYNGIVKDVVIPPKIGLLDVTRIGSSAFAMKKLTSVTIPDSVTVIDGFAFGDNKLTSITIPSTVTSIGDAAFLNNALEIVIFEGRSITLGSNLFSDNDKLTKIVGYDDNANAKLCVEDYNKYVEDINGEFGNYLNKITYEKIISVGFNPDGNISWSNSQKIALTVASYIPTAESYYKWTTTPTVEPDSNEWTPLVETDQISTPLVNGNWYLHVMFEENNGNKTLFDSKVFKIERTPPVIQLSVGSTAPTKQSVSVTAEVSDGQSGVALRKWADGNREVFYFANGGAAFSGDSFSVAENGTYTVYAQDVAGNESIETITISNIFTVSPTIQLTMNPSGPTRGNVSVTAAVYAQSGVEELKYVLGQQASSYFAGAGTPLTILDGTAEIAVVDNGWMSVYAKDHAGNETVKQVEIKTIDRKKPTISLVGNPVIEIRRGTGFTDPGVSASDEYDGDLTSRVVRSGDSIDIDKPGVYTVHYDVTDRAGNEAERVSRTVKIIEPEPSDGGCSNCGGSPTPAPTPTPTPTSKPFYNEKVNIDVIKTLVEEANSAPAVTFNDVPVNAPNAKAIELATKLEIIKGYKDGSFHANDTVTRAEFATMLVRALGLTSEGDSSFKDTKGHWAADAIATLKASGIINGYLDGTFKPNQTISRAEIVAMLSKVMNTSFVKNDKFKDVSGNWAEAEIDTLSDMGIVKGVTDGTFKPNANATRSESLLMILRMLNVSLGLSLDIE
ncbi:hypothetical protein Back11_02200 [Paenibacillus baekrokdamisoli]|uniref:Uncharacterized protein n=1 Tax=Paenibacillus baekrokdamisoli TaxID=1712516 RepID=A0A3G9ISD8_9BACL|nr:S-layer homology domain-containing protein [Paenibacillus baekrokdamisoli]MBB3069149.1 hypothetical protein [Paenibacillus baekrokdamisoli]BBH18875.1 hypothetical protein Back11_02200 [Paenibacillus baekrokdamisoli]